MSVITSLRSRDLGACEAINPKVGSKSPGVLAEHHGCEMVLYQRQGHRVIYLNQASAAVWDLCDGTRSVSQIAQHLCGEFGFDITDAMTATRALVTQFTAGEFVERSELDRVLARNGRDYASSTVEWVWAQRYELLGVGIIVRTNDRLAADTLSHCMEIFEAPGQAAPADMVFSVIAHTGDDGETIYDAARETPTEGAAKLLVKADTFDTAVMETIVRINSSIIHASRLFGLHAAGLTCGDRTLVIPATRNAGKSTLAAAALQLEFGYLSDENVALNWTDEPVVVPYPKPLWLSGWTLETLGIGGSACAWEAPEYKDSIVEATSIGGCIAPANRRITDVIDPERHDGPASLEPMSRAAGAALLIEHTFDRDLDPERVFRYAQVVARKCEFWKLRYSDPIEAVRLLEEQFGPVRASN